MKKRILRLFLGAALLLPMSTAMIACSEDAPTYAYSMEDLTDEKWTWTTEKGDIASSLEVTIEKIDDDKFAINNFHGLNEKMIVTMSGSSSTPVLSFSGKLNSQFTVLEGTGNITGGYQKMNLKYQIKDEDEDETEDIEATLSKGVIAKKAVSE
ncbi:MAG: hypothetical protein IKR41_05180 [Bacteroidales bacterium]|jgi:hypothetical protein|nr:hypothetical protein [Bacteroidales bacterium]